MCTKLSLGGHTTGIFKEAKKTYSMEFCWDSNTMRKDQMRCKMLKQRGSERGWPAPKMQCCCIYTDAFTTGFLHQRLWDYCR